MSRTKNIIGRLPHFFQSDEKDNHLYRLAGVFAALLDEAEEDLLKVMRAHWVNTADNEGSKGFDTSEKGDLDKILALFLENLGGTSLLRQTGRGTGDAGIEADRIYRDRMKGLIQVLLNGASTKEGIREIVGANLGILGNDPAAQYARETIRIEEFMPEIRETKHENAALFAQITEYNPNPEATRPEFVLSLSNFGYAMMSPKIVHIQSGAMWEYPGYLSNNDKLFFNSDGTVLNFNTGETIKAKDPQKGGVMIFPPGKNDFFIHAGFGSAQGKFDKTPFDYSHFDVQDIFILGSFSEGKFDFSMFDKVLFEKEAYFPPGLFDQNAFDNSIFPDVKEFGTVDVKLEVLKPASFSVVVPWDIPGFTVRFNLTDSGLKAIEGSLPTSSTDKENIISKLRGIVNQPQNSMTAVTALLSSLTDKKIIPDVLKAVFDGVQSGDDLFKELSINPRNQIKFIVDKVKAAGVYSVVVFEKRLADTHEVEDKVSLRATLETTTLHEINDAFKLDFSLVSNTNTIEHEIKETLYFIGIFDLAAKFDDRFCFG